MPAFQNKILTVSLLYLFSSCDPGKKTGTPSTAGIEGSKEQIKEQFMVANQQLMQKENDEMDYYVRSHKMPFTRTASGIRYYVYAPSAAGDSIREKSRVTMDYKVFLLDGTLCYSSEADGKRTFEVGQEEIESGIHKGLQYLKRGDKALLLIPSPLAHGLLGDFKKIPPQMPILYDVQVN